MSKYRNNFVKFNGDVLHQILLFLDVPGIYGWYRAIRTDTFARGGSSIYFEVYELMIYFITYNTSLRYSFLKYTKQHTRPGTRLSPD